MRVRTAVILILLSLINLSCFKTNSKIEREGQPDVFNVGEEDIEMNAAMQKARDTIAPFKEYLKNPKSNQDYFSLKVKFVDKDEVEHMWLNKIDYDDKNFYGNIGNDPVYVKNVKYDERVSITLEDVSDWMFVEDNKLIGGYTIRVLRDRMSKEEKKEFDSSFGIIIEE